MAITFADLIDPIGPLTTALFPGEDKLALQARCTAYLTAAGNDPRVAAIVAAVPTLADEASRAYALQRAYLAVVQRMNASPLTVNITEKGSHGYATAQIAAMQALADQYGADLEALLPDDSTSDPPATTTGVANAFGW